MDDLNLPIIKGKREKRHLNMDEYLDFVTSNLKHIPDIDSLRKWKERLAVNVRFEIKDDTVK